ncbi:MAG: 50S ribosomal protein L21 [Planctomycetota bacterium]
MYAVINDRGRQATVRVGDQLDIDLQASAAEGSEIRFDQVLLVGGESGTKVGAPNVDGASVTAKVLGATKGKKQVVFRFKRRKNVRVKRGHRQSYTRVEITSIDA